jgi:GT2 family glycosyltransferase
MPALSMNRSPLVSIVICTHNRAADLSECLDALIPQIKDQAEVIVVDSASNAENRVRIVQVAGRYGPVKLDCVDRPGLSLARNRGAQLAVGDWVVFLDDDVVPFPDWFEKLSGVLAAAAPDQVVVGGGIYPRWPDGMSGEHLSKRWKMFLSLAEAAEPGSVADGYAVNGANYAVRRRLLLDIGGFSENFGRVGGSLISGEDSQVTRKILDAGWQAGFDPGFKVYHKISPERLKVAWILRRTFWEGIGEMRMFRSRDQPLPPNLRPVKLLASTPALLLLSIVHWRNHDYKIRLAMCLGALKGFLGATDQVATSSQKCDTTSFGEREYQKSSGARQPGFREPPR